MILSTQQSWESELFFHLLSGERIPIVNDFFAKAGGYSESKRSQEMYRKSDFQMTDN